MDKINYINLYGNKEYEKIKKLDKLLTYTKIIKIINYQIILLKKRMPIFNNIDINIFTNFSLMKKYNIK